MNKILRLLDEKFVLELFRKEVLPQYPYFKDISRVEIKPYKELIWETTYHVVFGFKVYFIKADGGELKIPIVCSAHSDEPRENVYLALKYLWGLGLGKEEIDLPRPLFYSEEFNGTFYRGLSGQNLLYYIKNKKAAEIEKIVIAAAALFVRLHSLPAKTETNFNPINSRIKTVVPGIDNILEEMTLRYHGKYTADLQKIYDYFVEKEEKFFSSGQSLSLIHGDAHPENIIKTGVNRIGLIDFTDFCLGDFARDLGSFMQQLEYKIIRKTDDIASAEKMKKLFLDNYLKFSGLTLSSELQERINLYYNWTAIRTSTYWFLKFGHNEERAEILLNQVKKNLGF